MRFERVDGIRVPEELLIKTYETSPDKNTVTFMEWLKKQGFKTPKPSEVP